MQYLLQVHQATGGKGTWVWDRGADRDELMLPWLRHDVALIVRQRGDRHVCLADGRVPAVTDLVAELMPPAWPLGSP